MNNSENTIKDYVKKTEKNSFVTKQFANSLFHFTGRYEYLKKIIKNKSFSPRFVEEDISYLNLEMPEKKVNWIMTCFCDLNLHKLNYHVKQFGKYGIGIDKNWGIVNGLQPVQYINQEGALAKSFKKMFDYVYKKEGEDTSQDFLMHAMAYYKPHHGNFKNKKRYCFKDEQEWRYIPDISNVEGINPVEINMTDKQREDWSNALVDSNDAKLTFEYDEIKYIMLKDDNSFEKFKNFIQKNKKISKKEQLFLISKTFVWENIEGDL